MSVSLSWCGDELGGGGQEETIVAEAVEKVTAEVALNMRHLSFVHESKYN